MEVISRITVNNVIKSYTNLKEITSAFSWGKSICKSNNFSPSSENLPEVLIELCKLASNETPAKEMFNLEFWCYVQ